MQAMELVTDPKTKEPAAALAYRNARSRSRNAASSIVQGRSMYNNVLRMSPAMNIAKSDD